MSESAAVVNYAPEAGSVEIRSVAKLPSVKKMFWWRLRRSVFAEVIYINGLLRISWPVNYPVVLGHEFAGRIIELDAKFRAGGRGSDRQRNRGSDRPQ